MNNYMPPIVLHHRNFCHLLLEYKKTHSINEPHIFNLYLPVSGIGAPVSSFPDIPNSLPPDDLVVLVRLKISTFYLRESHSPITFLR